MSLVNNCLKSLFGGKDTNEEDVLKRKILEMDFPTNIY